MRNWFCTFFSITLLWTIPFGVEAGIDRDAIILALPFEEGRGRDAQDISSRGNHGILSEKAKWHRGNSECVYA